MSISKKFRKNNIVNVPFISQKIISLIIFVVVVLFIYSFRNLSPSADRVKLRFRSSKEVILDPSDKSINFDESSSEKIERHTIAVVIRAHDKYGIALISLLWCLESSQLPHNQRILAIVLPTELESITPLKNIVQAEWSNTTPNGHPRRVTAIVLDIPNEVYNNNCCILDKICTEDWRKRKLSENWPLDALQRYCDVNSPLHYALTDKALQHIPTLCPQCTAVLVTNADNLYAPTFFTKTLPMIDTAVSHENADHHSSDKFDVVMTDMVHMGASVRVESELGKMDLGGALMSLDFIRKHNIGFVSSLPLPAEPQHFHDADYWIVHTMQDKGARIHIHREILFNHY